MDNPILFKDFYKADHRSQYPEGTTLVYSNFTPRGSRMEGVDDIVFFGLQGFIKKWLIDKFSKDFFNRPLKEVVEEYEQFMDSTLGKGAINIEHIKSLHELGFLPIMIKAVPEGTLVPMRVPCLTIRNTLPDFFWLTNMLETLISTEIWGSCTSATTAFKYKRIFMKYATETGYDTEFINWQGHDFSMRGMFGAEAACMSGAGHLLSFTGTDTIPAILWLKKYYNADYTKSLVGASVPATEHSVMCMGGKDGEKETFKRLITEVYPSGVVSIVSDTWDFWNVLTNILPELFKEITLRNGKVVIRPDSGDPVDIICGNPNATRGSAEFKGAFELLHETFPGGLTKKGYRTLDEHIGLIYGDSITPERAEEICSRLAKKNFAPTVVFGIGSYTYQYVTRDTFGFAMKATYGEIDGEPQEIFKDPVTDNGLKKSAKGLLRVDKSSNGLTLSDSVTWDSEERGQLQTVFANGMLIEDYSLSDIRSTLISQVLPNGNKSGNDD